MGRVSSVRGASCLYQPDVFWLWRSRREGLIRPLACVPGLRNQLAQGSQRGQEYRKARAEPSGRGGVGRPKEPRVPCRRAWGVSTLEGRLHRVDLALCLGYLALEVLKLGANLTHRGVIGLTFDRRRQFIVGLLDAAQR